MNTLILVSRCVFGATLSTLIVCAVGILYNTSWSWASDFAQPIFGISLFLWATVLATRDFRLRGRNVS